MRVFIATVTAGAGHLQAAAALEEAWRALRPRDAVSRRDVLDFVPRMYRKAYVQGYLKVVAHAPDLYALFFKKTDNPKLVSRLTRLRRTLARMSASGFVRELKRFRPDVVLCPHFLPLEALGGVKDKLGTARPPLLVCVITDFEAHALWLEPAVDLYCVAAEETGARLVARGVAEADVVATGIPIAGKFAVTAAGADRAELRRRLALRDDLPALLVLSGGFGVGPVAAVLAALDRIERTLQVLVVTGRNAELRAELAAQPFRQPVRVLGFVDNMHELMAASDLVLTKPGGLTSSEALALGRPMLILDPIPGQEAANSDFLLERGAAIKVNHIEDIPHRVTRLLGSAKLSELEAHARALGRPDAARAVCAAALARRSARP